MATSSIKTDGLRLIATISANTYGQAMTALYNDYIKSMTIEQRRNLLLFEADSSGNGTTYHAENIGNSGVSFIRSGITYSSYAGNAIFIDKIAFTEPSTAVVKRVQSGENHGFSVTDYASTTFNGAYLLYSYK